MKYKYLFLYLAAAALIPTITSAKPKKNQGKVFERLDSNGDEVITLEEAESAGADRFIQNFNAIDSDRNGQVSKEELLEHHKQRMEERQAKREAMDLDGNGAISYDEAVQGGADKLVEHFDRIDADGDGEVTRREIRDARRQTRERGVRADDA